MTRTLTNEAASEAVRTNSTKRPSDGTDGPSQTIGKPTLAWMALALGGCLLFFADGRYLVPLASWLSTSCFLRVIRTQPTVRGLGLVYVVRVIVATVVLRGILPIPGAGYYIYIAISGAAGLIPYLFDRLTARALSPALRSLVFPATLVSLQFLTSFGPVGSWGGLGYTQAGNLPLLQILSVTGIWGVTFLIGWFASSVNDAWAGRTLRPLKIFVSVLGGVLLAGGARLSIFAPTAPTVRIASLSRLDSAPQAGDVSMEDVAMSRATPEELKRFREISAEGNSELLDRTEREARAGAKIVFWAEENAFLLNTDEGAFLERARAVSRSNRIYLGVTLATLSPGNRKPLENKLVMIDPNGAIAWQYLKGRLTPGPELAMAVPSDQKLRYIDTPYGRIVGAICFDADFPRYMAQAGAMGADIVLVSANDWRAIDPMHTRIVSFRPIEQGFNLVRQGSHGLSAAYDYQGRTLSMMDGFQASDRTLISQVPVKGIRTVYSRTGDWFPVLCILALMCCASYAVAQRDGRDLSMSLSD